MIFSRFYRCSVSFSRQQGVHSIVWSVLLTCWIQSKFIQQEKARESYSCSCSITYKGKRTDWITTLNTKNPLYLPLVLALQFFWGSESSRRDKIGHKIMWFNLRKNKYHISSETNTPSPTVNVVCKYLIQCLGSSFGIATISKCWEIE